MKRTITIQDIANSLGLSRNTVSKALNGGHLPEKTKTLVINKAKEMNYKNLNVSETKIKQNNYKILLLNIILNKIRNYNYQLDVIRIIQMRK